MKKFAFVLMVGVLVLGVGVAYAAVGPITRMGVEYSGAANPGECDLGADDVHPTELRVDCSPRTGATAGARVRYRFLSNVGAVRDHAVVSADIHQIRGATCTTEWMVPEAKSSARTLRVSVPLGSYCHIRSVTWSQP